MSELLSFILSQGEEFRRQRLASLYSDFTLQRRTNPDGFAANVSAWLNALKKAAQEGLIPKNGDDRDRLCLTTSDSLLQCLGTKELGRPLALGTVIDEAVAQRQIIPFTEFLKGRKDIHNQSWTSGPWQLFSWGFRQIGLLEPSTGAGTLPYRCFVILSNVEEGAVKILKQMGRDSNEIDRIYPMSLFIAKVAKIISSNDKISETDLQAILIYLSREKAVIDYNDKLVKFKASHETSVKISEQDVTISSLKSIISDLNVQIVQLSERITSLTSKAQESLQSKNRLAALASLRSKKLNENTLMQRSEFLARLEEVYGAIEQATGQHTMVRVMEASTAVLRELHAKMGGTDHVQDVVEGLRDEMSNVKDVSNALEAGGQSDGVVDEFDIDMELQAMERKAQSDEQKAQELRIQERLNHIESPNQDEARQSQQPVMAEDQAMPVDRSADILERLSLDDSAPTNAEKKISPELGPREPNLAI